MEEAAEREAVLPSGGALPEAAQERPVVTAKDLAKTAGCPPQLQAAVPAHSRSAVARRLVLLDLVTVAASEAASLVLLRQVWNFGRLSPLMAFAVPAIIVSFGIHGLYRSNGLRLAPTGIPTAGRVARSLPLAGLLLVLALVYGAPGHGAKVLVLTAAALVPALATVPGARTLVSRIGPRWLLGCRQKVIIVGSGDAAEAIVSRLERHGGVEVVGLVDDDPIPGFPTIGGVTDLARLCFVHGIDRIIVAVPKAPWLKVSEAIQPLIGPVDVAVVPSLYELMTWRSGTQDLSGMPLVPLLGARHTLVARATKRGIDIVGAALALVCTMPLLLGAAIAIRLTSRGPVLFRQLRAGVDAAPFTILKLRTMYADADELRASMRSSDEAALFKRPDDPRVTRVGAVLRRFSIDELPQLFNVLSGRMSLVGPRPYPLDESEALRLGPAASRFEVRPGMTGLWQVSGRSDLSWDDLCRLDAIYVRSWSLIWDLRILAQTPAAVLRSQGAY